jgi:hypothetical protein
MVEYGPTFQNFPKLKGAHTGKWQNNQQFDGGHSADEVEVEDSLVSTEIIGYKNRVIIWINSSY